MLKNRVLTECGLEFVKIKVSQNRKIPYCAFVMTGIRCMNLHTTRFCQYCPIFPYFFREIQFRDHEMLVKVMLVKWFKELTSSLHHKIKCAYEGSTNPYKPMKSIQFFHLTSVSPEKVSDRWHYVRNIFNVQMARN